MGAFLFIFEWKFSRYKLKWLSVGLKFVLFSTVSFRDWFEPLENLVKIEVGGVYCGCVWRIDGRKQKAVVGHLASAVEEGVKLSLTNDEGSSSWNSVWI